MKATLHGFQAAFAVPMAPGGRVVAMSSGAAMIGAPRSGSYAGAKRMIWLMARDANAIAEERGLPVRFQALLPMQLMADTPLGKAVAAEYAQRRGISVEAHVAERYGTAIAGLAQHVLSRITSRPRPYVQDCADDGKSTSHTCGDTRDNRSLYGGHSSAAFTAAGLTCLHQEHLPLWGGGAASSKPKSLIGRLMIPGRTVDGDHSWLWAPTFSAVDDGGIVAIRAVF